MYGVESLFEIYKVYVQGCLPLIHLFDDVSQYEYLLCCSSACPVTCLFLSQPAVDTISYAIYDDPSKYLSYYGSSLKQFNYNLPPKLGLRLRLHNSRIY